MSKNEKLNKFFKNKKVLVTGHTGFKGAWLTEILTLWGAKVTAIALPPHTSPNLYTILRLDKKTHSNFVDIRDLEAVQNVFLKVKPEIVFHLAAQAIVKISYEEPIRTYETNVIGTANILHAIRNTPSVKAAVVITSDKAYENQEWVHPYRELDRLGGVDPYSASKAAADIICQSFIKSFLTGEKSPLVAIGRAGNVIGGGDWASYRIVPDVVRAIYEAKEAVIVRNPASTRPWQFVLEPISGYLLLANKLYLGDKSLVSPWNFGPKEETSAPVIELVKEGVAILGEGTYKIIPDKSFHESKLLKLDISKARQLLGWYPKLNLKQTLEYTFNWYRNYYEKATDAIKFTDKQIQEFFNLE
jgi:CDP-glucose 4,6-dehydratase